MAAQTYKIKLHPKYSIFVDILRKNCCENVVNETVFFFSKGNRLPCLPSCKTRNYWVNIDNYRRPLRIPEETARAIAYHVTPICLFLKTHTQTFPFYHVLICYISLKEWFNIFDMFYTRFTLHRRAYQHPVAKAVEMM